MDFLPKAGPHFASHKLRGEKLANELRAMTMALGRSANEVREVAQATGSSSSGPSGYLLEDVEVNINPLPETYSAEEATLTNKDDGAEALLEQEKRVRSVLYHARSHIAEAVRLVEGAEEKIRKAEKERRRTSLEQEDLAFWKAALRARDAGRKKRQREFTRGRDILHTLRASYTRELNELSSRGTRLTDGGGSRAAAPGGSALPEDGRKVSEQLEKTSKELPFLRSIEAFVEDSISEMTQPRDFASDSTRRDKWTTVDALVNVLLEHTIRLVS